MYTYLNLETDIKYLSNLCIDTGSIGKSVLGRDIYYIHVGKYIGPQIIVTGGIHAREHISSYTVTKQAVYHLNNLSQFGDIDGGVYYIPMLNPDGNMLINKGLEGLSKSMALFVKAINNNSEDFSLFKANINGVDLNTNFDAKWGQGKHNKVTRGSENFIGDYPFCEPETRAIRDFTYKIVPEATVSYHCKGQEIYWQFGQKEKNKKRDEKIIKDLNKKLGYKIVTDDGSSVGGYKDWCIKEFKIPSYTIELCNDNLDHPINDYKVAKEDIKNNIDFPIQLLKKMVYKTY